MSEASAAASPRRSAHKPVVPGTPSMRAMPSFGPRLNSSSPRARSACAAVSRVPPGPMTWPIPATGPNACARGKISPAAPVPVRGTAGTMPRLRKSASRSQSPPDTPASPERNVSSLAVYTARTSGPSSHGGPPVARASSTLRWWERCSSSVRRTEASAPRPVFTPYTSRPSSSARRACSQRSCTVLSRSGPMATAVAGGDGPDEPEVRVAALGDHHHRYRYLSIVPASCSSARRRMARPTAMSRMASPRCHSRIRSWLDSRPGSRPVTIWPSSA